MTWSEWIYSEYNNGGYGVDIFDRLSTIDGISIGQDDIINNNSEYILLDDAEIDPI